MFDKAKTTEQAGRIAQANGSRVDYSGKKTVYIEKGEKAAWVQRGAFTISKKKIFLFIMGMLIIVSGSCGGLSTLIK